MARTIQQITKEIQGQFAPTIAELKKQQSRIGQSLKSEEAGLKAQQDQAFGDILLGAKRRGLKFSGIPLAEQSRYTSTEFLPALARLRQSAGDQRSQLALSIADVLNRRGTLAQELRQKELDRELSERLERERLAASRAAAAAQSSMFDGIFGGGGAGATQGQVTPSDEEIRKEARDFAGVYAQRLKASINDRIAVRRIYQNLVNRAKRNNDLQAREKAIAVGETFGFGNPFGSNTNNYGYTTSRNGNTISQVARF